MYFSVQKCFVVVVDVVHYDLRSNVTFFWFGLYRKFKEAPRDNKAVG